MANLTLSRSSFGPLFDDFLSDVLATRSGRMPWAEALESPAMSSISRARMDVVDCGSSFEVTMDLPGVKKEDINVSIEGMRVAVTAESKTERERKDGEKLLYSERSTASYARSFELPCEVTEDGAQASFEDGVLKLNLPKRPQVTSRRLEIR